MFKDDRDLIKQRYNVEYYLNNLSRYKKIDELLLYDNKVIKAMLSPLDMAIVGINIDNTITYQVPDKFKNRLDLIALEFYGTSTLYWVICYANSITNPYDIPTGKVLYIPDISLLRQAPNILT